MIRKNGSEGTNISGQFFLNLRKKLQKKEEEEKEKEKEKEEEEETIKEDMMKSQD